MSKTHPSRDRARTKAAAAEKRAKAMEARTAGLSYRQIAALVGFADGSAARKAVVQAIRDLHLEPAQDVLKMELERLDRIQASWWARGVGANADGRASDRLLAIIRQRCALLGLDRVTVKVEGPAAPAIVLSDAEMEALIRARDEHGKAGDGEA